MTLYVPDTNSSTPAPEFLAGRQQVLQAITEELVGPCPRGQAIDCDGDIIFWDEKMPHGALRQAGSGEEILFNSPVIQYNIGVLYPPKSTDSVEDEIFAHNNIVLGEALTGDNESSSMQNSASKDIEGILRDLGENLTESETLDFDLSNPNSYRPSSIGLSFELFLPVGEQLQVHVTGGRYQSRQALSKSDDALSNESVENVHSVPASQTLWLRSPIVTDALFSYDNLMHGEEHITLPSQTTASNLDGLRLSIGAYSRPHDDTSLVTIFLTNESETSGQMGKDCIFQTRFSVSITGGQGRGHFRPYREREFPESDEEEASLSLLYRNVRTFAVGHGCAADWSVEKEEQAREVRAECLPWYEVPSITADVLNADGVPIRISMASLAGLVEEDDGLAQLDALIGLYENWIERQCMRIPTLENRLQNTARLNMNLAKIALCRMKSGLVLLRTDEMALRAFKLSNYAMLLQQLRTTHKTSRATSNESGKLLVQPPFQATDWHTETNRGVWRPFQIAFMLATLSSTINPQSNDRETVDLIFFPTGGGKTEAYLGLAAFSMFYRRLKDPQDVGVDVLMRYTLRLLTAQQFSRASSMVCAMEYLRRIYECELGNRRFSIGIWIGGGSTPNTRAEARSNLRSLNKGDTYAKNVFLLLKCPWCSAQMGVIAKGKRDANAINVAGYIQNNNTVEFRCPDNACDFANGLPIMVIDEDIYANPPTFLLGTVDKFAMLPWKPEAKSLFGLGTHGERIASPPNLIIQDELQLISGPLGSMTGLYETLIDNLSTNYDTPQISVPKIVASTATIRRAEKQVIGLYGRTKSALFPPPGLDVADSFFASYAHTANGDLCPGRLYVGVHGTGLGSTQTTLVKTMAVILQAPTALTTEQQDPWQTVMMFFNTLRELGNSLSLLQSHVPHYLKFLCRRLNLDFSKMRKLYNVLELTSRLSSDKIPQSIERLEVATTNNSHPVDVCLASNIIEVGIDIDRLSLMMVVGQPQTTTQYIQATGRIGRKWWERPGLVVTIYSSAKPRDRSHFERFRSYHERLYAQVEPASVTPFSPPVLERALHAVLIAYIRLLGKGDVLPNNVPQELIQAAKKMLEDRASIVDPNEVDNLRETFSRRCRELRAWQRIYWSEGSSEEAPLMRRPDAYVISSTRNSSWKIPQSLRNVDAECRAEITSRYNRSGDCDA